MAEILVISTKWGPISFWCAHYMG